MPSETVRLDPQIGAKLTVALALPGAIKAGPDLTKPAWSKVDALIDTGSNTSCVGTTIAHRIGLTVAGITTMLSGNQTRDVNNYRSDLVVPLGLSNRFVQSQLYPGLRLTEFRGDMETDMLLGLDVLQNLTIIFDGPARQVTVSAA
jgi:Aspartyl protease